MKPRQLVRVTIWKDGSRFYVTPYYRLPNGQVVSVPDDRGFSTMIEAIQEKVRIENGT